MRQFPSLSATSPSHVDCKAEKKVATNPSNTKKMAKNELLEVASEIEMGCIWKFMELEGKGPSNTGNIRPFVTGLGTRVITYKKHQQIAGEPSLLFLELHRA